MNLKLAGVLDSPLVFVLPRGLGAFLSADAASTYNTAAHRRTHRTPFCINALSAVFVFVSRTALCTCGTFCTGADPFGAGCAGAWATRRPLIPVDAAGVHTDTYKLVNAMCVCTR